MGQSQNMSREKHKGTGKFTILRKRIVRGSLRPSLGNQKTEKGEAPKCRSGAWGWREGLYTLCKKSFLTKVPGKRTAAVRHGPLS